MVGSFRKRRFFRIFWAEDSQRMETPPAFRKYLQDKIPSMFSLVGPSGHTWKVELEIGQQGVLFGNGWENFVDDHSLEFGDLLVFKFDGDSSFSVLVFDKTACEKMSAFSAKPRCRCSCHKRKGKREAVFVSSSEDSVMEEVEKKAKYLRPSKEGGDEAEAALFSTRERRVKEARAKANSFKSSSPSVVVTMRKSNVSVGGHLRLPAPFSSNIHFSQLSRRKEMILRTPSGGIWTVSLLSINKQKFLSAGWRKFAVENNLKVDDACVFELLRDNDEMLVHLFKVRR